MKMSYEAHGDLGVLRVAEARIDASVAIEFKDRFRDLTGASAGPVVLDLSTVEFLDSSGLGAVVAARKLLGPDRALILAALTPAVDKVMTLTRMNTVFEIHPDPEAALSHHGASATG